MLALSFKQQAHCRASTLLPALPSLCCLIFSLCLPVPLSCHIFCDLPSQPPVASFYPICLCPTPVSFCVCFDFYLFFLQLGCLPSFLFYTLALSRNDYTQYEVSTVCQHPYSASHLIHKEENTHTLNIQEPNVTQMNWCTDISCQCLRTAEFPTRAAH